MPTDPDANVTFYHRSASRESAAGGVTRGSPDEVLLHKVNRHVWVFPSEGFPAARWTAAGRVLWCYAPAVAPTHAPAPAPSNAREGSSSEEGLLRRRRRAIRVQRKGRSPRWAPFLMVSQHGSPKKALAGFFNNSPLHIFLCLCYFHPSCSLISFSDICLKH